MSLGPTNGKANLIRYLSAHGRDVPMNERQTHFNVSSSIVRLHNVSDSLSPSATPFKGKTSLAFLHLVNNRPEHQSSTPKEVDTHGNLFTSVAFHKSWNGTSDKITKASYKRLALPTRHISNGSATFDVIEDNPVHNTTTGIPEQFPSQSSNVFQNILPADGALGQLANFMQTNNIILSQENVILKVVDALLLHAQGNDTAFLQVLFDSMGGMSLPPDIVKKLGRLYGNSGSIDFNDILGYLTEEQKSIFADFIIKQLSPLSPTCLDHLSELSKDNTTALELLDAFGKPPSGILQGNLKWTGSFDECLSLKGLGRGPKTFDGKYCTAKVPLDEILINVTDIKSMEAEVGLCVPDSCNRYDVRFFVDLFLVLAPLGNISLLTSDVTCHETARYDTLAIASILFFASYGLFILFATLMDIRFTKDASIELKDRIKANRESEDGGVQRDKLDTSMVTNTGIRARLLVSFSMYTNGRMLLSGKRPRDSFGAVNGIRFLSISWVILGHTFISMASSGRMANQQTFVPSFLHQWTGGVIVNSSLSVDTFFTLSGLLLSYVFMKEMKRLNGHINWFMYYLHRIWRLAPPYMLVMFMYVALLRYTGDGPFWQKNGSEKDFCTKTWWRNLLYINNFVDTNNSCMAWTWYLANDMQFYLISPLLLVPLYFSRRLGGLVCGLVLLVITITTYIVSYQLHLPAVMFTSDPSSLTTKSDYFPYYFVRPYCRIGPYIVGIVAGYILYTKEKNFKLNKEMNLLLWFLMTLMGAVVTFGVYGPVTGATLTPGIAALYNATYRSVWGVVVSWIVFACVTGHGGFINTLLSWEAFVPLGRLTYCVYLVHPILLYYYTATTRQTIYVTNNTLGYAFIGTLVLSHMLAFLVSVVLEAPMKELEKVVFKRIRK